jgi:hypothetical protein
MARRSICRYGLDRGMLHIEHDIAHAWNCTPAVRPSRPPPNESSRRSSSVTTLVLPTAASEPSRICFIHNYWDIPAHGRHTLTNARFHDGLICYEQLLCRFRVIISIIRPLRHLCCTPCCSINRVGREDASRVWHDTVYGVPQDLKKSLI